MDTETVAKIRTALERYRGSDAIIEALGALAIVPAPGRWIAEFDNQSGMLYLLEDGVMHRLRGEPLDHSKDPATANVEYDTLPIGRDARFSFVASVPATLPSPPETEEESKQKTSRQWIFRLNDKDEDVISILFKGDPEEYDPGRLGFVRAVAREIGRRAGQQTT
jgi:hypothetical protein